MTVTAEDRWAISDLLSRYCHATDDKDRASMSVLLTDDHVGELGPAGRYVGRDEVIAAVTDLVANVVTRHSVSTSVVEATDSGAYGRTAFTAHHTGPAGAQFTVGGTYRDDFVRSPRGWLIAQRRIQVVWFDGDPDVLGVSM